MSKFSMPLANKQTGSSVIIVLAPIRPSCVGGGGPGARDKVSNRSGILNYSFQAAYKSSAAVAFNFTYGHLLVSMNLLKLW